MAIRNTNYGGGSNWTEEGLKPTDLNDTINAIANYDPFTVTSDSEVSSGTTGSFAVVRTFTFNKATRGYSIVSFQIKRTSTSGSGWFQLQKNGTALTETQYQVLDSKYTTANNINFTKYAATPTQIETKTDGGYISVSILIRTTFAINDTLKFAIDNNVAASTMYIKEITLLEQAVLNNSNITAS